MDKKISSWELLRDMINRFSYMRVQEELYQWWAKRNKTISYVSAGVFGILTLHEDEAFEILRNACFKLAGREYIFWDEFEKRRLQSIIKINNETENKVGEKNQKL